MLPAFSVIFLTTLIGLGQGLFLALFTVESYALFDLLPHPDDAFYARGSALALALLLAGLAASFFHLGRPQRAWRAAAQWRTSWLSREVIVLPAFMALVFCYGAAHGLAWRPALITLPGGVPVGPTLFIGALATLAAFGLFLCTGMIYACLRFLREWHTPLTVINFILLGGASGFLLAAVYAGFAAPALLRFFAGWALIILSLAALGRSAALLRNQRLKPKSTLQSAIGVKHPRIRQTAQGAMGGSFNTREFFHGKTRATVNGVRWLFLLGTFALPGLLLAAALLGEDSGADGLLRAAFVSQCIGLIAERWFFFAQARHPQNLYYQAAS